jgi:hypothetical protein
MPVQLDNKTSEQNFEELAREYADDGLEKLYRGPRCSHGVQLTDYCPWCERNKEFLLEAP